MLYECDAKMMRMLKLEMMEMEVYYMIPRLMLISVDC